MRVCVRIPMTCRRHHAREEKAAAAVMAVYVTRGKHLGYGWLVLAAALALFAWCGQPGASASASATAAAAATRAATDVPRAALLHIHSVHGDRGHRGNAVWRQGGDDDAAEHQCAESSEAGTTIGCWADVTRGGTDEAERRCEANGGVPDTMSCRGEPLAANETASFSTGCDEAPENAWCQSVAAESACRREPDDTRRIVFCHRTDPYEAIANLPACASICAAVVITQGNATVEIPGCQRAECQGAAQGGPAAGGGGGGGGGGDGA